MNRKERRRRQKAAAGNVRPAAASRKTSPGVPEIAAMGQRAVALFEQNRLDQADAMCRRILAVDPENTGGLHLHALVLHRLGNSVEAIDLLRRALAKRPNDAETISNLGGMLRETGDGAGAIKAYHRAVELCPDNPQFHVLLGDALAATGAAERRKQAVEAFHRAVELAPRNGRFHNKLGRALLSSGRHAESAEAFQRALDLEPGNAEFWGDLGQALIAGDTRSGFVFLGPSRRRKAIAAFRRAIDAGPEKASCHIKIGKLLLASIRHEEAVASFRRGIDLEPENAGFHSNLASALLEQGKFSEAAEANRRALAIDPAMAPAYLSLANAAPSAITEDDEAAMQELLSRPSRNPEFTIDLHFALGQVYDARRRFDTAFRHFEEANRLMRAASTYRLSDDEDMFERIKTVFSRDLIAGAKGGGTSRLPIFIIGMSRSGTTLVEQILASHSQVEGLGEIAELTRVAAELDHRPANAPGFPEAMAGLGADGLGELGRKYLDAVLEYAPGAARITDKMPGNFRLAGLIRMILPKARIVHCMRDPVATCFSCFISPFALKGFASDLADTGAYYRAYLGLMDHWRQVLPRDAILDLGYEDLVADPEREARRLLKFCGLSWEDGCLDFHRSRHAVKTASVAQVRKKIYRTSIDRWKPYRAQLGPLFEALGPVVGKANR